MYVFEIDTASIPLTAILNTKVIDVKKYNTLLFTILALILTCAPVHGAITDDPCGCDPLLLQRADNGDVNVQSYVAFLYATGKEGVQQNYEKARYWYQRIINHKSADAKIVGHANLRMGLMYNNGKGVTRSYAKALECYRQAAEQGYYEAHLSIGILYAKGLGVKKDYNKAIHWWKIAAANSQPQAQPLINLLRKEMRTKTAAVKTSAAVGNNS